MRVFITMRRVLVLFLMLLSLPAALPVSAQEWTLCGDAVGVVPDVGNVVGGYEVVSGSGGSGSQIVVGTDGQDSLSGGSGNDVLCGYGGNDILEGDSGNDILVGGKGANELYGGSGNDTLYVSESDWVDEGSGQDVIIPVTVVSPDCDEAWQYDKSQGISLSGVNWSGCDLSGIQIYDGVLTDAYLIGTILIGSELIGLDMSGADFSNADLTNASLHNSNLSDAILTGVTWGNTTCPDGTNSDEHANLACVALP